MRVPTLSMRISVAITMKTKLRLLSKAQGSIGVGVTNELERVKKEKPLFTCRIHRIMRLILSLLAAPVIP